MPRMLVVAILATSIAVISSEESLPSWHPRRYRTASRSERLGSRIQGNSLREFHTQELPASKSTELHVRGQPFSEAKAIDSSCNARAHVDLDGPAVSWGLSYKLDSAAECCEACRDHQKKDDQPGDCNSWVWCPLPECWSPDIWNHTFGECWLKIQADIQNPKVNHEGAYSFEYRSHHKTAPLMVPWIAGVIDREQLR